MSELNKEQKWLANEIKQWPEGWQAATRGPFDEIIPVYPRKCTADYCITEDQWFAENFPLKDSVSDVSKEDITVIFDEAYSKPFQYIYAKLALGDKPVSVDEIVSIIRAEGDHNYARRIMIEWLKQQGEKTL